MAYCTKQDLIDRFSERELIQLTDRINRPATTVDDTVVTRAIGDASALIDGYVGKVYALPLSPAPAILTKVAADIARFNLHGQGVDKDSPIRAAYSDAVAYLKDVARGLVSLVDEATGEQSPETSADSIQVVAPERVMTRDSLRGY